MTASSFYWQKSCKESCAYHCFKFSVAFRPQRDHKDYQLGTGVQDGHLDFHTAPELLTSLQLLSNFISLGRADIFFSVLLYVHRNHQAY